MDQDQYFRINSPSVVFERFDDEVVAINLESGVYHSLTGCAADIFHLLEQSASLPEMRDLLERKYDASSGDIEAAITPFLAKLDEHGLSAKSTDAASARPPLFLPGIGSEARAAFVPPAIEAYSDLQNLLLLDPVHDVGEMGWPQQPNPGSPS